MVGSIVAGYLAFAGAGAFVDEFIYISYIRGVISEGRVFPVPFTALPGYHLVLAGLLTITGFKGRAAWRLCALAISLSGLLGMSLLLRHVDRARATVRTTLFALFPLAFPFLFLIYTDYLSLGLVALLALFTLRGRLWLAALFGLLAIAVRQNNVAWIGFAMGLVYLEVSPTGRPDAERILLFTRRVAPFLLVAVLFAVFVVLNGGVAMEHAEGHPVGFLGVGNVAGVLFVHLLLFLPLHIVQLRCVWALRSCRWAWIGGALWLAAFLLDYDVTHPSNHADPSYHIHNAIVIASNRNIWTKLAYGLVTTFAALSISTIKLRTRPLYLLYPVSVLYLALSWQIEFRYYFIPLGLFFVFMQAPSTRVHYALLTYYVIASALLVWATARHWVFI